MSGEEALEKIRDFVHTRTRLCFGGHKKRAFRKKVEDRIAQIGVDTAGYADLLLRSPREEQALVDLLTTNETFFFRNEKQFSFLRDTVLPGVEQERGEQVVRSWGGEAPADPRSLMKLRILSAGCSTGEEPYSIAMTVLESLRYSKAWDIRIVAGDISESCIRTGEKGFYDDASLRNLPARYRNYVDPASSGGVISPDVRRLVTFVPLNLQEVLSGSPFPHLEFDSPGFDVIFCRNVMIYFSIDTQQQLVDTLTRWLAPGGYLFTGDAEPLHLYRHELEAVPDAGCLVYRKRKG